jgi:hypothetical protein
MKTRTQTTAAKTASASDPAQIGRDLAAIWRLVEWNHENRPPADAPAEQRNRFKLLDSYLGDRWSALEAMAAEIQAGSLEGAMIQIMLAHAEADVMAASTEESNEAQMRTISKLLYSALAAIEQVSGVPREELGGEHYMCRDLDPHVLVAEGMKERAA